MKQEQLRKDVYAMVKNKSTMKEMIEILNTDPATIRTTSITPNIEIDVTIFLFINVSSPG